MSSNEVSHHGTLDLKELSGLWKKCKIKRATNFYKKKKKSQKLSSLISHSSKAASLFFTSGWPLQPISLVDVMLRPVISRGRKRWVVFNFFFSFCILSNAALFIFFQKPDNFLQVAKQRADLWLCCEWKTEMRESWKLFYMTLPNSWDIFEVAQVTYVCIHMER